MAKNFTQFGTATPLTTGDFIVGYKQDGSVELKTTIKQVIDVVETNSSLVNKTTFVAVTGSIVASSPYVEVIRSPEAGSQQRINDQEYLFEWDVKNFETNSAVLSGNASNYNIVINQPGFYEVEARYGAYDLRQDPTDYLLMRLRGGTQPVTGVFTTANLLELLDIRAPATTTALNGQATTFGRTIVRITQVPYYLAISYQGGAGDADGSIAYYTIDTSDYGNLPRIRVRKLSNL